MLIILTIMVASCSDDNDAPTPSTKMVLTSIQGGYLDDTTYGYTFIYNNDGTVKEMTTDTGDKYQYIFNETSIEVKEQEKGEQEIKTYTFQLKDGLVVKNCDGTNFLYNASGRMVSTTNDNSLLTWTDGNISNVQETSSYVGTSEWTYVYSDKTNLANFNYLLGFMYSSCYPSETNSPSQAFAAILYLQGYFGMDSKNICKQINVDGDLDRTIEYTSVNAHGYPEKIKIVDYDRDVQVYTLTWSKM